MLAEQIATLETNYTDAQAKIAAQDSSIETLTVSVAALTKDKLQLEATLADAQKRVADLEAHNDETMAAVESLAKSALDMLRVAQRPPGTPAAVIPFAPKPKIDLAAGIQVADAFERAKQADSLKAVADAVNIDPPGQAAVTEIMANDSGDEQPPEIVAAPQPQPAPQPAIVTNDTPAASDDAMNRIHSTALPDNVMTGGPLPVFLQRDTVLQREGVNVLG